MSDEFSSLHEAVTITMTRLAWKLKRVEMIKIYSGGLPYRNQSDQTAEVAPQGVGSTARPIPREPVAGFYRRPAGAARED